VRVYLSFYAACPWSLVNTADRLVMDHCFLGLPLLVSSQDYGCFE
jgi:hypothetical protein